MKHCALNLLTGEIIATNTGNNLKRNLKAHKKYNGAGNWLFSHQGLSGLDIKYNKEKLKCFKLLQKEK